MKKSPFHNKAICILVSLLMWGLPSCSKRATVTPPFLPLDNIATKKIVDVEAEPAGMTGHSQTFIVWDLVAASNDVDAATSSSLVRNNLYWQKGRSDQFNQALEFFEAYDTYRKIRPDIQDVLTDPDIRFAYTRLSFFQGRVAWVSVWVCSPKAKKIVYLDAY